MRYQLRVIIICVISLFAAIMLTLFAQNSLLSRRDSIATVDVKRAVDDFSRALAINTHLSDLQKEHFTNQFASALSYSISEYAKLHHITIVNQQSVLAGGNDITDKIERFVQEQLTKSNRIGNNAGEKNAA